MSSQVEDEDVAIVDGRKLRGQRNRESIIEACIALNAEGILVPTAQQISDKAGMGIRSFFRHFSDMEELFATIEIHSRASVEALFVGGDRDGTLPERILHAVERHAEAYEHQKNSIKSTTAQMWRYKILQESYARYQRGLRKDLDNWLPELKSLSRSDRESVDAVASAEMWMRLRDQGLSKKHAISNIVKLLTLLVPG